MIGIRGKLNQLRNPECRACDLWKSATNVCVMGRGNVHAPVMLVGEAPGRAEAIHGKPFMGEAGERLNAMLHKLAMADLVYICNTCRCKPPPKTKPNEDQICVCTKLYLNSEIRIIEPRLIVALGRIPMDYFFPRGEAERGTIRPAHVAGRWRLILPTWHPAYLLHSGSKVAAKQLFEALEKAKRFVSKV